MNRMFSPFRHGALAACVSGLLAGSPGVQAQMQLPPAAAGEDWSLRLGGSVLTLPKYPGASKMRVLGFPDFELRYKDFFFADPIRGVGVTARPLDGLELRASLGFAPDVRRVKDDARFVGLQDIKTAGALNLGVTYSLGDAFVEATLRSRLASAGRRGTTAEALLGYNLVATASTRLGLGLSVKAMDKTYARTFFGVTDAESAASGLRSFTAGSGLNSAGGFVQLTHQIDRDWLVSSHVESLRLRSDAAASPIVRKKAQTLFVFSVLRAF